MGNPLDIFESFLTNEILLFCFKNKLNKFMELIYIKGRAILTIDLLNKLHNYWHKLFMKICSKVTLT